MILGNPLLDMALEAPALPEFLYHAGLLPDKRYAEVKSVVRGIVGNITAVDNLGAAATAYYGLATTLLPLAIDQYDVWCDDFDCQSPSSLPLSFFLSPFFRVDRALKAMSAPSAGKRRLSRQAPTPNDLEWP